MNYGILIAVGVDGAFQVVGLIDDIYEGLDLAANYIAHGPDSGWLAPESFQIHYRGKDGAYTVIAPMNMRRWQ